VTGTPASCIGCDVRDGRVRPPGGTVLRTPEFVVYGFTDPTPVRGYVIVSSLRHVRGLYDLDAAEAAALGPLLVRVQRAQKEALGADHAYVHVIGDLVPHFHAHVVPRFADAPAHLRGKRVLFATEADARPGAEVESACRALEAALARAPA
jgi:diadenosine tetraphosphate (Ap4A) HIT family hydrolase